MCSEGITFFVETLKNRDNVSVGRESKGEKQMTGWGFSSLIQLKMLNWFYLRHCAVD